MSGTTDVQGRPIMDFGRYERAWNDSFRFDFVTLDQRTAADHSILERARDVATLVGLDLGRLGPER